MKFVFFTSFLLLVVFLCTSGGDYDVILKFNRNDDYTAYTLAWFRGQEGDKIYLTPRYLKAIMEFTRDDIIFDKPPLEEELQPGVRVIAQIARDRYNLRWRIPAKIIERKIDGTYKVQPACEEKSPPLISSDGYMYKILPDEAFHASSYYDEDHKPNQARWTLNIGTWCSASNDIDNPWLQVDFEKMSAICSVTTRMDVYEKRAVTAFTLAFSSDSLVWHHVMEKDNTRKIFRRDFPNNIVTHFLNLVDKRYRYIRFYPTSYHKHPCMAVEVRGYQRIGRTTVELQTIRLEGSRCKSQNRCTTVANAKCHKEGKELGTYTCRCKSGFAGSVNVFKPNETNVMKCLDIDECLQNDVCGHGTCTNTPGSYRCTCTNGYGIPSGNLTTCIDLDECSASTSPCSPHARCTNTDGSFTCQCHQGYQGNGYTCVDIDECNPDAGSSICKSAYSFCTNSPGSYKCTCQAGFTGSGKDCTDINECNADPNLCKYMNGTCFNSIGSYSCHCLNGYNLEAGICQETDECSNPAWNNCNQHATCTNKPGSYSCDCKVGFKGSGHDQFGCTDIDECSEKNKCGAHSSCENNEGSFTCTCDKGYTSQSGMHCQDMDECSTGKSNCHHLATCKNLPGSFTCQCPPGFTGRGDVTDGCTVLSWCHWKGDAKCNKEFRNCSDIIRRCTGCKLGYEEINHACQDINECKKKPCGQGASCVNTPGSFKCQCHKGYISNSRTQRCDDMDECSSTTPHCHVDALCENTPGSYSCRCKKGFDGDGFYCADTNECYLGAYQCPANAVCSNTLGSYKCTCKMGYHRSKDTCKKDATSKKTTGKQDLQLSSLFDFKFLWNSGSILRSQTLWKIFFLATAATTVNVLA